MSVYGLYNDDVLDIASLLGVTSNRKQLRRALIRIRSVVQRVYLPTVAWERAYPEVKKARKDLERLEHALDLTKSYLDGFAAYTDLRASVRQMLKGEFPCGSSVTRPIIESRRSLIAALYEIFVDVTGDDPYISRKRSNAINVQKSRFRRLVDLVLRASGEELTHVALKKAIQRNFT